MKTTLMVSDFMTAQPIVLTAEMPLHSAAAMFLKHRISGAPVVDAQGILIGVLSQVDLAREAFRGPFADFSEGTFFVGLPFVEGEFGAPSDTGILNKTVEDAMCQGAIAVAADDTIVSAARRMVEHKVHRVVVVDGQSTRKVVGILSTLDLLKAIT